LEENKFDLIIPFPIRSTEEGLDSQRKEGDEEETENGSRSVFF
jgi:hypothetical protein